MHVVPTHSVVQNAIPLTETELAESMAKFVSSGGEGSTAEMLRNLRAAFPDSPLAVRVRALAALQRR
jgi:hypothetical protein